MPRSSSRAAPLCLALVCLAVDASAPSTAAAQAEPSEMHGFLRYKVRGLSAVQGGFLSGSIMAVATGVGMQSAVVNMLRLLGGAVKLSKDPGMAEMHNYLSTGKGFDFSGAPVSAGYDVHLDFVLESDGKGNYRLKSGNASYSGNTDADLTLGGDGANVHRFTDRFRGQGTAKLTPQNSSITLTTTGKGKDQRVPQFDVSVSFPVMVVGKAIWSAMGGLQVITMEDRGDVTISHLQAFGSQQSESSPQSQSYAGVVYGWSGRPDSELRGRETWQDLTDSGTMVEWELWPECKAEMVTPKLNDELVYNRLTPGRISRIAHAKVEPSFLDEDLEWNFHPILGSQLEFHEMDDVKPRPERSKGNIFEARYDTLPSKNSSFAYWDVSANFVTERARRAGCRSPKPRRVGYFFARDATNHGGPPGQLEPDTKPEGPTPNWFHYWMQTKARAGVPVDFVRYGGRGPGCFGTITDTVNGMEIKRTGPLAYAYYTYGTRHLVMCDFAMANLNFRGWNPLGAGFAPEGIDVLGPTILHEKQHHDNYWRWWSTGYKSADDPDKDHIPNEIEKDVPVPPEVRTRRKCFDRKIPGPCFNPKLRDSFGYKIEDEHYLAWAVMYRWPLGSANREDWSCPGKLAKGCK